MTRPTLAGIEGLAERSRERFEGLAARLGAGARARPAARPALTEGQSGDR